MLILLLYVDKNKDCRRTLLQFLVPPQDPAVTAVTTNTKVEEYNPFADQPPPPPEVSVLIILYVSVVSLRLMINIVNMFH